MGGKEGPRSGDIGKPFIRRSDERRSPVDPHILHGPIVPIEHGPIEHPEHPEHPEKVVISEVMTVRFEISMPAVIRLGAQITLEVQISLRPDTSPPPETGEVKLSIFSPGFRLLKGHVRHVSLSLKKEQSIRERFDMEAQEEGKHKIRVSVFFGGTWQGSTTVESQVAANVETGQASCCLNQFRSLFRLI